MSDLGGNALKLLDELYRRPLLNINAARDYLGVTFPTAAKLVADFERRDLLDELTGYRRNRVYPYTSYLDLFADAATAESGPIETTGSP